MTDSDRLAVEKFREYLRIDTSHPNPDYRPAVSFLRQYAKELDLELEVFWCVPETKPVVILKWQGSEPGIPCLMLNSHMDVVPVDRDKWTYEPFAGDRSENGDIYARGAQDMKSVGMQYMEAIRRLKKSGTTNFRRTIFLTFVPEEEVSGKNGMDIFAFSDYFKAMNVGFALDEGLANPGEEFKVYYGERSRWWMEFNCPGNTGHASGFVEDTAAEKLRKLTNSFMDFRHSEQRRMLRDSLRLGDVTTVNLTVVQGGSQANVVPSKIRAVFDMRVATDVDENELSSRIEEWRRQAGQDVQLTYQRKAPTIRSRKPDRGHEWYRGFYDAIDELGLKIDEEIFPAGTDSRFLRAQGIEALGFSPMNFTPVLLHDHNEFLNEGVFLRGIGIYEKVIAKLADQ